MSQYHYTNTNSVDEELDKEAEIAFKEWQDRIFKQRQCKHKKASSPSGMGFGECPDCGALI